MFTITVSNLKGGVTKTTTTINLAVALTRAQPDIGVLVVDMDPQASATSVLLGHKQTEPNVYHLLQDRKGQLPVDQLVHETSESSVFIIPSNATLENAEADFSKYVDNQRILLNRLQTIAQEFSFSYILIDAPPRIKFLNFNCLFAADAVIVPVMTDMFSVEGIADLVDDISDVAHSRGRHTIDVSFLLCRVERTRSATRISDELREVYGQRVFETAIPKNVAVSDAHEHHASVLTYAPASTGAQAYKHLAQEVLTHYGSQE